MAYVTTAECRTYYGTKYVDLSVDRNKDGLPEDDALQMLIDDQSSFVDFYLSKVYKLPLNPVPYGLKGPVIDLVIYKASPDIGPYTVEKRVRRDDAIKFLEALADGVIDLGADQVPAVGEPLIIWSANERVMTRETLRRVL